MGGGGGEGKGKGIEENEKKTCRVWNHTAAFLLGRKEGKNIKMTFHWKDSLKKINR